MVSVARLKPKTAPPDAGDAHLEKIPIDKIDQNEDNPRVVFRQDELEQLLESVNLYGIQVPISVYRDGSRYVLIDGERRWRVSQKLNLREIPALVQAKPTPLNNLLMMFNIHALREQWELLTVAMKLPKVIQLLSEELGYEPKEPELAERVGIPRAWIRRAKLLLEMPQHYRDMLLEELKKPKHQQKLSEDLLIEMERAIKTVQRTMPDLVPNRDRARRVLLDKYRHGTIDNLVDFRKLARIARAHVVQADETKARIAINRLLQKNEYSIKDAYNASVAEAYLERDVLTRIEGLVDRLRQLAPDDIDDDVKVHLRSLIQIAQELLDEIEE